MRVRSIAKVIAVAGVIAACKSEGTSTSTSTSTSTTATATATTTTSTPTTTSSRARAALATAKVPAIGFAVVSREREEVGAVGIADVAQKSDATGDTVFEAASIAKVIVATCVMQMVEDKKLDLDADVGTYVGFTVRHPKFTDPITLRMLLTHRASIRDRSDLGTTRARGNPLPAFLQTYFISGDAPRAASFLDARPGTAMTYSNVGAAVAALAVERVAGESFAKIATRRVFEPLRMTSTSWTPPRTACALPHALHDGAFVTLPQLSHAVYPAVDLFSSPRDLARFARAILRDGELDGTRILSAESVRAMLHGDGDQALAWQLRTIGGARVVGHEGEDAGATTGLFLDLARGSGAIVLANGDAFGSGDKARAEAIQNLFATMLASSP